MGLGVKMRFGGVWVKFEIGVVGIGIVGSIELNGTCGWDRGTGLDGIT